ncbi:F-box only protein 32-like isoform X2 [Ptychodera flava]
MDNTDNNREETQYMEGPNKPLFIFVPKGPRDFAHGFVNLAEVMMKLDFGLVARDPRKFNYVSKVMELIITLQFSDVSGTTQKHILNVIGQMVNHAVEEMSQNIRRVEELLKLVEKALIDGRLRHVGSAKVWEKKLATVQKWRKELSSVEFPAREDDGDMILTDLPDDCLRHIIHRIPDHRDLVNLGATTYRLNRLVNEGSQWKDLCIYHFTEKQIWSALPDYEDDLDWQKIYRKLNKRHKKQEQYAEKLKLCNRCHCVYWNFGGHPCTGTENDEFADVEHLQGARDISPQEFIKVLF